MTIGGLSGILGAIIGVATLTVLLGSTNTANILTSLFNGFTGSLRAAMGK